MKNILDIIEEHVWLQELIITTIIMAIIFIFVDQRIAKLYKVQADIVIHDYGHIYEDINDWKLERIEKYEKEEKWKN